MTISKEDLDAIANEYHLSDVPDLFIENICQLHTLKWLAAETQPIGDVLELGYGDGLFTEKLVDLGHAVTLVEGAESLVVKSRAKYGEQIRVHHTLFEEFETPSSFDYVIATHVLEHVDDPIAVLNRIKTWLKPSGKLIVIVPNKESLHRRLAVEMTLQPELDTLSGRDVIVGHQRVYSLETLSRDIEAAGFEVQTTKGFFLKVLPNSMMLEFSEELILALNEVADLVPKSLLANIGITAGVGA